MLIRVQGASPQATCPLCRDPIGSEACGRCGECDTLYHRSCFLELGGCATSGCPAKGVPAKGAAPRPRRSAVETCAYCREPGEIGRGILNCRQCGVRRHAGCVDPAAACARCRGERPEPRPIPAVTQRDEAVRDLACRSLIGITWSLGFGMLAIQAGQQVIGWLLIGAAFFLIGLTALRAAGEEA